MVLDEHPSEEDEDNNPGGERFCDSQGYIVRLDYILSTNAWLRAHYKFLRGQRTKIECKFVATGPGPWKTVSINKQRDGRPTPVGVKRLTEIKGASSDIFS